MFSLTWPASMQIYWNKESVCIRKQFNSQRSGLGHQHGRRFIVLGHQYGRRDVMWKHSIFGSLIQSINQSVNQSINKKTQLPFWRFRIIPYVPFLAQIILYGRSWFNPVRKGLKTYKTILKAAKYCIIYFFISTTKIIHFNPIFVNLLFLWIKINNDYRTNSALRILRFLYHHPATCYKKYLTIQKTKKRQKI